MNMFVLRSGFSVDSGTPRANASGELGLREILPGVPPVRARASFGTVLKLPVRSACHLGLRSSLSTLNR